jgi:hypothetical protein
MIHFADTSGVNGAEDLAIDAWLIFSILFYNYIAVFLVKLYREMSGKLQLGEVVVSSTASGHGLHADSVKSETLRKPVRQARGRYRRPGEIAPRAPPPCLPTTCVNAHSSCASSLCPRTTCWGRTG